MIYLDHAATTPLDGDALAAMLPYMTDIFGNPSSQHFYGREAANAVQNARDLIAGIIGVPSGDLYFTGSGTEAANTALKGVCLANADRGKHIVVSAIEHPSVLESARDMRRLGFSVTEVYPDSDGVISPQSVEAAIRADTVFVAVMAANNETGVIQPVKDIYAVCRERGAFYYCDCVQTAGVTPFAEADGIGFSAHKFYGPKGFGGLYIKKGTRFARLISGGKQERGLRGGTTFAAGAVGCAVALKKAVSQAEENNARIKKLRDGFVKSCLTVSGCLLNGSADKRLPSNANLFFDGCDGEKLNFMLDLAGIAASTGSACSSGAVTPSHVLLAMGLGEARARQSVRFSFGRSNTEEEARLAFEAVRAAVNKIRGI